MNVKLDESGSPFKIGDRIIHRKHGLVEIVDGQYMGTYGVSNFWEWKKVQVDGELGKKVYSGYGRGEEFDFKTKYHLKSITLNELRKLIMFKEGINVVVMEPNDPFLRITILGVKYRLRISECNIIEE